MKSIPTKISDTRENVCSALGIPLNRSYRLFSPRQQPGLVLMADVFDVLRSAARNGAKVNGISLPALMGIAEVSERTGMNRRRAHSFVRRLCPHFYISNKTILVTEDDLTATLASKRRRRSRIARDFELQPFKEILAKAYPNEQQKTKGENHE